MTSKSALSKSIGICTETFSTLQKSKTNKDYNALKAQWAKNVLSHLDLDLNVRGTVSEQPATLFIGNHISYLDIPLLMSLVPGISFVAKQEIKKWPIFGKGAEKSDTVFVKRESHSSRNAAKESIQLALQQNKRIVIFPSGTTCIDEQKSWRKGAFDIAQNIDCFVQPFRLSYEPLRDVAYIDDDFFPTHLYKLFKLKKVKAIIEFHEPVKITNAIEDCLKWNSWAKELTSL